MKRSSTRRGRGGQDRTGRQRLGRQLAREERLNGRRLAAAVAPNDQCPVLGRANVVYELSERSRGIAHGGMGLIAELVASVDLAGEIDSSLELLQVHRPYFESDHVLNIAYTNSSREIEPGVTITDAIARRDGLRLRRGLYAGLADAAAGQQARGEWQAFAPVRQMRSELRYLSAVDVPELRRMADAVAKEHRELDTRVQQANWKVDLAD